MLFIFADSFENLSAQTTVSVVLTWVDNSLDENGFYIERATGAGSFSQIGIVAADVVQYTDSTAQISTTYYYRIAAYNYYGLSAYSEIIEVIVSDGSTPSTSSSSGGGGGGGGGGGSSLTATVIQPNSNGSQTSPPNSGSSSGDESEPEAGVNSNTISGRSIDGTLGNFRLSPILIYIALASLIGFVFYKIVHTVLRKIAYQDAIAIATPSYTNVEMSQPPGQST